MPIFRTRFQTPASVSLDLVADPDASTVTLTAGASSDPYFFSFRFYARDSAGNFVLIAEQADPVYVDAAARLGLNELRVTVSNGAEESEPTDAEIVLTGAIPGGGMALVPGSERLRVPLLLDSFSFTRDQQRNVLRPLDATKPVELRGVAGTRQGSMSVRVPADTLIWTELLEEMAGGDDPVIVKDSSGRVHVLSLGMPAVNYSENGWESLTLSWLQVG